MKKFLNPKILIPALVGLLLISAVLYILLAPSTWWKPFYVRVEGDEIAATGDQSSTNGDVQPAVTQYATAQNITPQGAAPPGTIPATPYGPQILTHVQGIMYELDPKVVNLAEPGGLRYLQTSIVLEFWPLIEGYPNLGKEEQALAEDEFRTTIDAWRPVIDDIVMTQLSSKTYNDVATVEGKQNLKQELMTSINAQLGYQGVINIYFTNFIVQ